MDGKTDYHLNLDFGMEAAAFEKWAGFRASGLSALEIREFAVEKIAGGGSALDFFSLSLDRALDSGVREAFCNADFSFVRAFGSVRGFCSSIRELREKYAGKNLRLNFYLQLDSDGEADFSETDGLGADSCAQVFSALASGEFCGISLKGRNFLKEPKQFAHFVYSARRHAQKIKLDFSLRGGALAKEIDGDILQSVLPNVVSGSSLFDADFFLAHKSFLRDRQIPVDFSGKTSPDIEARLRLLGESGVSVRRGSGDILA